MSQIEQIIFKPPQHLDHCVGITVVECGMGSDARSHLIKVYISTIIFKNFVDIAFTFRPMANEGHISFEYVKQLREFIYMMSAQKTPHISQARIIVALP